ncbi:WG repeat-containing protein [Virgibacillus sp. W0430]|uniref:WG repeat-containing protein n=1 Tax=Virgibacillus sp. W0430 TaxID=3391580 RepID=UPI003F48B453
MTNVNMIKAEHGKPCVIDYEGNILIEPRIDVDTLFYPSNGLSIVGKGGKYGYINQSGKLVIPMKYKKAYPFAENGLAFVVCQNGLGGYMNKEGEFIIDPIYETGSLFRFGFAAVSRDNEYIYIYNNGSKAINNTFKYAGGFSDCGLAKVVGFDGKHALMDTTSLEVLSLKLGCELAGFKDGSRITKFRKNNREALINAAGEIITGYYEKIIISPYNRLHRFLRNGLWGYLDNQGNEVIPNIYKKASAFEAYKQYKVAAVESYHPLAKNNVVNLYINEKDEIVDSNLIEASKQHLIEKFPKVNRFKAQLALAIKKEEEKAKTYTQGGVKNRNEKQHNDEHKEKAQTGKNEPANDETNDEKNDDRQDIVNEVRFESKEEKYYEQFIDESNMGSLYEVSIFFRNMPIKKEIYDFLNDGLAAGIIVVDIKVNYARLLWPISDWEDPGDIENALYYLLDDVRLGEYKYTYVDSYYSTTSNIE